MDKKITYKAKDNDLLYVVDEATGEIDYNHSETKMDMHKLHLWHNEAALFIINKQGKILLQKRSQNVHFNKGKRGMVANHPNINQTIVESVVEKAKEEISMNMIANILGLGNAATPLGLKAMQSMQEENSTKDTLTDPMMMFIVLNTASIQLIPTTVIAIRNSLGSENPTSIVFPVWIATIAAAIAGITVTKIIIKSTKNNNK